MPPPLPWLPLGVFRLQRPSVALAPERGHARLEVEAELNGRGNGWTDLTADLMDDPGLSIEYGISDTGPTALVASSGEMRFALANGAWNSAGLEGYYSPGHTNCRVGFRVGIRVRFTMIINGVRYRKHVGWLADIEPIAGRFRERKTVCSSLDWMDQAAKANPTIATQANRTSGLVAGAMVAAVPQLPESTLIDAGDSTFAFALDNSQNESGSALSELQRIAQSEPGWIYCKGDGTLRFERRSSRYSPTPFATFNETTQGMTVVQALNQLRNKIKITTHPRRVDAGTSILATNQGKPLIASGETRRFTLYYTDPANRSQRCGGTGIIPPVSATDYTANTLENGAGTNLTSSFSVSIVGVAGANSADVDVTNASGSSGYLTLLQLRGSYLLDYDPIDSVVQDSPSIATYGETRFIQDMPYQSDAAVAAVVGSNILSVWGNPQVNEVTLRYIPPDDASLAVALAVEPGTALGAVESITGVNGTFYVQHVSLRAFTDKVFQFEWLCQRAVAQPYVQTRAQSFQAADVTNHTLTMPSGITAGDLLIAAFSVDGQPFVPGLPTITWPAGWTEFAAQNHEIFGNITGRVSLAYRRADGTEGASITVTTSNAQTSTHICYRITGAENPAVKPPQAATAFTFAVEMDPPRLSVALVQNNLWLAIVGFYNPGVNPYVSNFTVIPPGYTSPVCQTGASGTVSVGGAEKIFRADSEDPGGFRIVDTSGTSFGIPAATFTVVVFPAS